MIMEKIVYNQVFNTGLKPRSPQTHHVYSTLKQRGNDGFHVVSTWNTRGVFVGKILKIQIITKQQIWHQWLL